MFISRVKWSNPEKGVAPSSTPQCCSYWIWSLLVALNLGSPTLLTDMISNNSSWFISIIICLHIRSGDISYHTPKMDSSNLNMFSKRASSEKTNSKDTGGGRLNYYITQWRQELMRRLDQLVRRCWNKNMSQRGWAPRPPVEQPRRTRTTHGDVRRGWGGQYVAVFVQSPTPSLTHKPFK